LDDQRKAVKDENEEFIENVMYVSSKKEELVKETDDLKK
jgi:hypothetical protein